MCQTCLTAKGFSELLCPELVLLLSYFPRFTSDMTGTQLLPKQVNERTCHCNCYVNVVALNCVTLQVDLIHLSYNYASNNYVLITYFITKMAHVQQNTVPVTETR